MILSAKKSAFIVIIITLLLFLRGIFCDFVNYDDPQYVYSNPGIRIFDWQFLYESFTTSYMGWWMPLTWISFALDYQLWELNPLGYHLTNILLHAANAGLVVLIAHKIIPFLENRTITGTGSISLYLVPLLAGLLWGIHPLRVESVVWVTERKDVLSGFFTFLAIFFYLRRGFSEKAHLLSVLYNRNYLLTLIFFLLAMLAKPVSVVLPVMFLVLDWYPLGRIHRARVKTVLGEKIPLFFLSIVIAVSTVYCATGESILVSLSDYPLYKRLLIAGYALVEYIRMSIYPFGLVHLYSLPTSFSLQHYLFAVMALLISGYFIAQYKKQPWLLATWLLYILPLLPVLGFFQNGIQSHADRFTYLPALFPSIASTVGLVTFYQYLKNKSRLQVQIYGVVCFAVLLGFGIITIALIGAWKNSATLWSRLIEVQPVGRAYYYRGEYYLRIGKYSEAITDLEVSIRLAQERRIPGIHNIHALLGDALSKAGRLEEAVREFTTAIALNPLPNYFYHRGVALLKSGRAAEAENDFKTAGAATGPIVWNGF